jgi:hypothetical protein
MPMHNTAQGGHEAKPDGAESRYLDLESSRELRVCAGEWRLT